MCNRITVLALRGRLRRGHLPAEPLERRPHSVGGSVAAELYILSVKGVKVPLACELREWGGPGSVNCIIENEQGETLGVCGAWVE